ncbi:DUF6864 domain-containing function [Pseudomonas syringae pv. coryli]|uniref:DUF6864 domain-containing function n=1 Tax=Pseudomonas syringae pv. coryli TaxID=317659 RepID=UPI003D2710CB
MPDVKVYSPDGWELVYNLTIHLCNSMVTVVYDGLPIDIVFKKDDTGEVRYSSSFNGVRWVLELFNFSNALGEGKLEPIPFAFSEGRQIKLTFYVQTLNVEMFNRVLSLNFFKEPAK